MRKAALVIPATVVTGLALGVAVAGLTPTRIVDHADEPWRDQGKALAEAEAKVEEERSRLSGNYGFADRTPQSREERAARADEMLARGRIDEPDAIGEMAPLPEVEYEPLGINDIRLRSRADLPPPKPTVREEADPVAPPVVAPEPAPAKAPRGIY